tara:strand:- start:1874 stop:3007 length:1134 start_codon:yes stop_codon:yes gene_type:complete
MLMAGCCCIKEELPCRNWSTCDKDFIYLEITIGKSKLQNFTSNFRRENCPPSTTINLIRNNDHNLNFSIVARFGIYLRRNIVFPDNRVEYEMPFNFPFGENAISQGYLIPYNFSVSGTREEETEFSEYLFPNCDAEQSGLEKESRSWDVEPISQDGESPDNYSIDNLRFKITEKRGTDVPCFNPNETCYLELNIQGLGLRYLYDFSKSGYTQNCDFNCNCTPNYYGDGDSGGGTIGFGGTADWVISTDNTIDDCEDILEVINRVPLQDTFSFIPDTSGTTAFFSGTGGTGCVFNISTCANNPNDADGLDLPNNCNNGQYVGALALGSKRVECNKSETDGCSGLDAFLTIDERNCEMIGTFDFNVTRLTPSDGPEQQP